MRAVVVLALLVVAVAAAAPNAVSNQPARRCDKGWVQVGQKLCCPRDHSVLIDGTCYNHCNDDSDDMALGAWVGCREKCEPGYSSNINQCSNGILTRDRVDHSREGVKPKAQRSVSAVAASTISACETGLVKVKGGCCPHDKPKLIAGQCYGGCDQGKEEIAIGNFVGCRASCPDGWDQKNNVCSQSGQDDTDRGDFPRFGDAVADRVIVPTPKHDDDSGCGNGYLRASKHYCCPATNPVLKGLLCYEHCKTGFEESGYGCRQKCKTGWTESVLECGKGAKRHRRKGYERHPKPSKLRI